ncbi:hypothetical protein EO244_00415 [Ancylomarina salipaludis]|uniref:Uncharacterized protein n=1 Tax=Ancylomarina salipaludis TaxID=2501299 RepID=A0A4Q1JPY7_9BACT|nr:hypothetical protein [Ancylomarina salipaludis]RXQ97386.1 hypothetical protein EO244_00415 [Ancylomarina salipaludis]
MEKLSTCNIKRNKKLLVSDIIKYYETRGYTLIDANAYGMTLKKGSWWGNFTSLNPLKWRTIVRLDVIKVEKMDYDLLAKYKFSSAGQFSSPKTKLYFTKEAEAFNEAMLNFKVDIDEIEQIGNEALTENKKNLIASFFMGTLIAILLIFAFKIYLPADLPQWANSGITLLSIIFCNYVLNQTNKTDN